MVTGAGRESNRQDGHGADKLRGGDQGACRGWRTAASSCPASVGRSNRTASQSNHFGFCGSMEKLRMRQTVNTCSRLGGRPPAPLRRPLRSV